MKKTIIIQIVSGIIACILGVCTCILGVFCLLEKVEIGCVIISLLVSMFVGAIAIVLTVYNLTKKK